MAEDTETSFIDKSNQSDVELLDKSEPSVQLEGSEHTEKVGESEPVPKLPKDSETTKIVILPLFLAHSKLKKRNFLSASKPLKITKLFF